MYGNEISKEGWTQYGFKQVRFGSRVRVLRIDDVAAQLDICTTSQIPNTKSQIPRSCFQVKADVRKVGPKKWDYMGLSRDIKSSASAREQLLPCICETDTDPETLYGAVPLERSQPLDPLTQTISLSGGPKPSTANLELCCPRAMHMLLVSSPLGPTSAGRYAFLMC